MASTVKTDELVFFVNGKKVIEKNADPEMTLLTYLRRKLGLTGSKLGCGEGGCGACTVMVSRYNPSQEKIVHLAVNACLSPVCSLHLAAVTTIEGIGSVTSRIHPIQERIAKAHGSQCGFCTPGIVMSMYTLLRNNTLPTMEEIEEAFQGNLCRCTGYRPILEGMRTFSKSSGCCGALQNGNSCCMKSKETDENCTLQTDFTSRLFDSSEFKPLDPTQEPIFPPELLMLIQKTSTQVQFQGERVSWIQPNSLSDLLCLKAKHPDAKLVVGNTEVGIEMKFKNMLYPVIIAPNYIPEMTSVLHSEDGIVFGSACTLTVLAETLKKAVSKVPDNKTRVFQAVLAQLKWFAGQQIRNVSGIGGNVMTASPISDLNPVFMAANCKMTIVSKDGKREVRMDDKFFTGYRKTALKPNEILLSIEIPYSRKGQYISAFKQAQRRDDDIAIVTCGMNAIFHESTTIVKDIKLSYGGMAETTVLAKKTCEQLIGKQWNEDLLQEAVYHLAQEITLSPSAPGGMVQYRQTLTLSLFYKFYLTVLQNLANDLMDKNIASSLILPAYASATDAFHKDPISSVQLFQAVPPGQEIDDVVGRPLVHLSALKQATGEAIYCDDMPRFQNELYLALVTSTKAHAKILSIDTTEALKLPGVVCFVSAKDISGSNATGPVFQDETVFADDEVTCIGHIIGAVVADTQEHANRAAKVVNVAYKELSYIITIQEAIAKKSFYEPIRKLEKGNLKKGFEEADHVLEGEIHIGGQEHFYLETHCALAVPKMEEGEIELFVSTQNPHATQSHAAKALGVPSSRVVCRVKRIGGGFGGKETRNSILSTVVAVAANKMKCPVRCMLSRDEDMLVSGGRHPFFGKYKVGFMKTGQVTAVDVSYYSNAGNSIDLSFSIMERALFHMDNVYNIPNIRGLGYVCKTNLPSNTAFRGFGGPQGMITSECWINDVASVCGLPAEEVRRKHMCKEGDITPFNQILNDLTIERCWEECLKNSQYYCLRDQVNEFNRQHRWKKRGLAIIPVKFGISFTVTFLNQAGALVHVYTDGSVLLTHGGTEMGQGLHTKMIQVASKVLKIPVSKIYVSETSTNTVPNTSPTAASVSSDLNGMAVYNACQTILKRLKPYQDKHPDGTWEDWVRAAYFDRVNLSANGFYKIPDIGYDFEKNEGIPFSYFSYGVACSEVEIDCLTGDHKNLHTWIVMDVGNSLNPAIDIGQIEGAFMQGVGLFTLEELRYSPSGYLHTRGPGSYKIPGFGDIPGTLHVSLLREAPNSKAIFCSKAIGEPPLLLATSVFFAIKDAISAARAESNLTGPFRLDSPATPERIRNACADYFTKLIHPQDPQTFTPWAVQV
ncbi:xanthine dehydrogenase/oxidase isoform X1 [Erpetoichthys calabaricus]|uniref:xanthine dehydrogenase/oxidase isoform X1 n=1 Tax=Erpetoichthys calabaricus TaxID=27687 RepID=UPI002234C094|nr:xanthine dehydrogenase/oxidase isoform X1 [Erpetoichthys calabaricus]